MLFNTAALLLLLTSAVLAVPAKPKAGDIIPDQYIVIMKGGVSATEFTAHQTSVDQIQTAELSKRGNRGKRAQSTFSHTYDFGNLKGYAGTFDAAIIEQIANLPEVAYVEPNRVVTTQALVTQAAVPSWGLARISHRAQGATTYVYDETAGAGITAYIVDTGVLASHTEFGGRAAAGANFIRGETAVDGNGHGTHVAGTIAGSTYGVSKAAHVVGVKVLGATGSGSNAGVISGVQWVTQDAQAKGRIGKAVANMSLGGSYSAAVNSAVTAAVDAGIPFAVAAGNSNDNAANYSPASATGAITVGATASTDVRASYSNYGTVLDIFAPGTGITSSWIGSNTATNTISGTSMASPHICGFAAYLMAFEKLTKPAQIAARMIALSSANVVTSPGTGSPNRLAYNGSGL